MYVWVCGADEAEGRLMQLVQRDWVGGSTAARSQSAEAGMAVLTQMWEAQGPTSHKRLHSHLDATILEEVRTCSCEYQIQRTVCATRHQFENSVLSVS